MREEVVMRGRESGDSAVLRRGKDLWEDVIGCSNPEGKRVDWL